MTGQSRCNSNFLEVVGRQNGAINLPVTAGHFLRIAIPFLNNRKKIYVVIFGSTNKELVGLPRC